MAQVILLVANENNETTCSSSVTAFITAHWLGCDSSEIIGIPYESHGNPFPITTWEPQVDAPYFFHIESWYYFQFNEMTFDKESSIYIFQQICNSNFGLISDEMNLTFLRYYN